MANPSRTEFPAYTDKLPLCAFCGKRVRLKDWWGCYWDEEKQLGRVWHLHCHPFDPFRGSATVKAL